MHYQIRQQEQNQFTNKEITAKEAIQWRIQWRSTTSAVLFQWEFSTWSFLAWVFGQDGSRRRRRSSTIRRILFWPAGISDSSLVFSQWQVNLVFCFLRGNHFHWRSFLFFFFQILKRKKKEPKIIYTHLRFNKFNKSISQLFVPNSFAHWNCLI